MCRVLNVTERLTREGDVVRYQAIAEDPTVLMHPWEMNLRTLRLNTTSNAFF